MTKTRHDEMKDRFEAFDAAHPEVWVMFKRFTFDRIERGHQHYGANAIVERIRWEAAGGGDTVLEFKINDHYPPHYARKFHLAFPYHAGFFRTRVMTSKAKPATDRPPSTPADIGDTQETMGQW